MKSIYDRSKRIESHMFNFSFNRRMDEYWSDINNFWNSTSKGFHLKACEEFIVLAQEVLDEK